MDVRDRCITSQKYHLRLISKQSIFALQLTVPPLMHLKCPRIHLRGCYALLIGQKNLPEQQRIGKHNIPESFGMR